MRAMSDNQAHRDSRNVSLSVNDDIQCNMGCPNKSLWYQCQQNHSTT